MSQSLLDTYGIQSEGELFSGSYMTLKNRLSDKDSDGMSCWRVPYASTGKFRHVALQHATRHRAAADREFRQRKAGIL